MKITEEQLAMRIREMEKMIKRQGGPDEVPPCVNVDLACLKELEELRKFLQRTAGK